MVGRNRIIKSTFRMHELAREQRIIIVLKRSKKQLDKKKMGGEGKGGREREERGKRGGRCEGEEIEKSFSK